MERGNGSEGGGRERRGGDGKGRETGDKEIEPEASGVICLSLLLPSILTILCVVCVSELEGSRTTESRRRMLIESDFCSFSPATFSIVTVLTIELEGTIRGGKRVGERERVGGEGERVGESEEEEEGDEGDFEGEGWRECRGWSVGSVLDIDDPEEDGEDLVDDGAMESKRSDTGSDT